MFVDADLLFAVPVAAVFVVLALWPERWAFLPASVRAGVWLAVACGFAAVAVLLVCRDESWLRVAGWAFAGVAPVRVARMERQVAPAERMWRRWDRRAEPRPDWADAVEWARERRQQTTNGGT